MKNINAKKVLMFDENIMYAFNNLTPSHRSGRRERVLIRVNSWSRISWTSLFIRERRNNIGHYYQKDVF